jgi:hypothetical protein
MKTQLQHNIIEILSLHLIISLCHIQLYYVVTATLELSHSRE